MATEQLVIASTGYPGTNDTLRALNTAILENAAAFAMLAGGTCIISGLDPGDDYYSDGWVTFNGEILPFQGGVPCESVTIIEENFAAEYDADTNNDGINDILPVSKTRIMKFGTDGEVTLPFTDLVRLKSFLELSQFSLPEHIVLDDAYVHTDNNFTNALLNKLNGIAVGAEVNVQADWNAINPLDDAFIKNKPTSVAKWLAAPTMIYIGDVYTDSIIPISFPTVGSGNYVVVGHLVSYGTEWNYDNDVVWMVKDLTSTGFKLLLKEVTGDTQQLRFKYGLLSV